MGTLLGVAIKSASKAPVVSLDNATISLESGVQGDHRGKPGDRQVTVLSRESWEDACQQIDQDLPWTVRRANLLIEGPSLVDSTGSRLQVGDVVLEITGETKPCPRMDEASPGLKDALVPAWRGGATCKVIRGGKVSIGDPVSIQE